MKRTYERLAAAIVRINEQLVLSLETGQEIDMIREMERIQQLENRLMQIGTQLGIGSAAQPQVFCNYVCRWNP